MRHSADCLFFVRRFRRTRAVEQLRRRHFASTLAGTLLILAIALSISFAISKLCRFEKEDEITTVFAAPKTLASGVPMAKVIFGAAALSGDLDIGLIVLLIMFYHQLQLLVCTVLANRYAKRLSETEPVR